MELPLDIDIKNQEILDHLNNLKEEFFVLESKHGLAFAKNANIGKTSSEKAIKDPEWFLSDDYLNMMIEKGNRHRGFPEEFSAWPISRLAVANTAWCGLMDNIKNNLAIKFGASKSSLASYYEPGGFVGWHTNWNNSNYQILFTWSETGDSYFKYKDIESGEIIKIQERPGWQAHLVYFGTRKESHYVFWHAAYTNCKRFAWALSWENKGIGSPIDNYAKQIVRECVEELEYEI